MSSSVPYKTTNQLVKDVELTMSLPLSQLTFTYNDIVNFLNQEMLLNAVPTVLEERQEYFVFRKAIPLIPNISRYEIPNRSIAMTIRDLKFADLNGNFFNMARISPEDKSFFQQSGNSNQVVGRFYLEGNEVVLTNLNQTSPNGFLYFNFYLRPNQLVADERAAFINNFRKQIRVISNSSIQAGDTITLGVGQQSVNPEFITLTATTNPNPSTLEFTIGVNSSVTGVNIGNAISNLPHFSYQSGNPASTANILYKDISTIFESSRPNAIAINTDTIEIVFNQLPSNYTDPVTDITSSLYTQNSLVDFLQTRPGHRTFNYDVPFVEITSPNSAKFNVEDLKQFASNSNSGTKTFYDIRIGDYICLAQECIIPQIPPELHHALAERAASRVLMSMGDKEGLAVSVSKIREMDQKQMTLINDRVESSPTKVFNKNSLLRLGRSRFSRF